MSAMRSASSLARARRTDRPPRACRAQGAARPGRPGATTGRQATSLQARVSRAAGRASPPSPSASARSRNGAVCRGAVAPRRHAEGPSTSATVRVPRRDGGGSTKARRRSGAPRRRRTSPRAGRRARSSEPVEGDEERSAARRRPARQWCAPKPTGRCSTEGDGGVPVRGTAASTWASLTWGGGSRTVVVCRHEAPNPGGGLDPREWTGRADELAGRAPEHGPADRLVRPALRRGRGGRGHDAVGPHRSERRRCARRRSGRDCAVRVAAPSSSAAGSGRTRRTSPRWASRRRASTCRRTRSVWRESGSQTAASSSALPTCSTCRPEWRGVRPRRRDLHDPGGARAATQPTSRSGVRSLRRAGRHAVGDPVPRERRGRLHRGAAVRAGRGPDPGAGRRHPRPGRARGHRRSAVARGAPPTAVERDDRAVT